MTSPRARWVIVTLAIVAGSACGRPRKPKPSTTTLVVRVTDGVTPVGARVLLFSPDGAPVRMGSIDLYGQRQGAAACAIAPGVVGSWDGLILAHGSAEVPVGADACAPSPAIPYGRYRVWAWRGIEYERWEGEVDLSADRGRVELAIALERAWTPHGTLAADLHVHAFASNDSRVPNLQRVTAQVAAGVQVIGLSDHNTNGDLDAEITELGLDGVVASIASNELTADQLHVGVYPVVVDAAKPRGGAIPAAQLAGADAARMLAVARALPGNPIVQLNHPRFRYTALFDSVGWDGVAWPPPFPLDFDALEVIAGYSAANVTGDRRLDDSVRDYLTLLDHGRLITPLGNSDTHDLNWVLDGTARTYVFVEERREPTRDRVQIASAGAAADRAPGAVEAARRPPFDEAGFLTALRGRRVVATTGPWLDVEVSAAAGATPTVGPGGSLHASGTAWVDVTLAQARFVRVERIRITIGTAAGPALVQTIEVPAGARTHRWAGAIELGRADTWIEVTADGDTPLPLELTGTYQRDKWKRPGVTPFALTGPILVDVDGDGRWTRGDADLALP